MYPLFQHFMSVCFVHTSLSVYWNFMQLSYKWEVLLAMKPGLTHHFLQKKMPVPSQKYDSCYPFDWCAWAIGFCHLNTINNNNKMTDPHKKCFCQVFLRIVYINVITPRSSSIFLNYKCAYVPRLLIYILK